MMQYDGYVHDENDAIQGDSETMARLCKYKARQTDAAVELLPAEETDTETSHVCRRLVQGF